MKGAAAPDVFYPIVPNAAWLERIAHLGVRTAQLRIKDTTPEETREEIRAASAIAKKTAAASS